MPRWTEVAREYWLAKDAILKRKCNDMPLITGIDASRFTPTALADILRESGILPPALPEEFGVDMAELIIERLVFKGILHVE